MGEIDHYTTALTGIGGLAEEEFITYTMDAELLQNGINILAVELHQVDKSSSDLSFDLELLVITENLDNCFSSNPTLTFSHTGSENLIAVFEGDGSCILPEEITSEFILKKECSPYRVPNTVIITSTGKLVIDPGVEIWFSDGVSIEVNGSVQALGTVAEPVIFKSNPESENQKWGILNFINADTSFLKNIVVENASKGFHPQRETGAISIYNSVIKIDGAELLNNYENPVVARYSDVSVINSKFHSEIAGDLINVKYGKGFIDSCEFIGNKMPDNDGIDFDDVENGIIRNSVIRNFLGFNSDAIDIGEQAKNIFIENLTIFDITDKGVSVGQQSSAKISNLIFVNCNLGVGIKDSSRVIIDHCTYYGNGTPVACFEKNEGDAGGNAIVTNSILSNAYYATYSCDSKSTIQIFYSTSDNDLLPEVTENKFVDPQFGNPNRFDFSLLLNSPCLAAGSTGNIGSENHVVTDFNQLFISDIAYKSEPSSEVNEFVEIKNSGETNIDISGYKFTKGITFRFPEGTILKAGEKMCIAFNSGSDFWLGRGFMVYQWESGRLADEGETLQLETPEGIIVDNVKYNNNSSWPNISNGQGITLASENLDNHFGKNWKSFNLANLMHTNEISASPDIHIYPNPTHGIVYFSGLAQKDLMVEIFNLAGIKVKSQWLHTGESSMNLSDLNQGVYLVRSPSFRQRIVIMK